MTYRPNRRMEILGRVALVLAVLLVVRGMFVVDVPYFWSRAAHIGVHHLPYRDFMWEFPPLTLLPLALMRLTGVPVAYLLFPLGMAACEYGSLELLRKIRPDQAAAITRWWHLVCLPAALFAYFRFDFLSVLPACLALASMQRRDGRSSRWIVAGVAAKLWPALLVVPLACERRFREASIAIAATAALLAVWVGFSPAGFQQFMRYRAGRGVQIESLAGSLAHPFLGRPAFVSGAWVVGGSGWGWVDPLALLTVTTVALALVVVSRRRRVDLMAGMAGIVILLLTCSRLFSPQYLVWAIPFVVLAAVDGSRRPAAAFGVATLMTVGIMETYRSLVFGAGLPMVAVILRNVVLLIAAAGFLRAAFRPNRVTEVSGPEESLVIAVNADA